MFQLSMRVMLLWQLQRARAFGADVDYGQAPDKRL
jgi:hypothetical protein